MNRRTFLRLSLLTAGATITLSAPVKAGSVQSSRPAYRVRPFDLEEVTIPQLQARFATGKLSAVSLAKKYLARIEEIDRRGPALNSIIELNPDALELADALDRERKARGPRGALHGIPVLLKDNLDTHDRMMTTAGSLALLALFRLVIHS